MSFLFPRRCCNARLLQLNVVILLSSFLLLGLYYRSNDFEYLRDLVDSKTRHGDGIPTIPEWRAPSKSNPEVLDEIPEMNDANSVPTWAYSIKPLAYVFPQFHPIPENDKFWGENFTEWTNVVKVTHNVYGGETLRPAASIGYYNLLDYSTRERYRDLIRYMNFHGIVYHHYWFEGRPVMQRALEAMLDDGEPDVPFMLSWANEPWTKHWDGQDGHDVLLAQQYGGPDAWRTHFDWLLPYFRHKNYIRVGGRVQFVIYGPNHIGATGKHMYAAWKQWAVEEGLEGLDIIETYIQHSVPSPDTDAVNEFQFRTSGSQDPIHWPMENRVAKVYHRGARVGWDNSPRHASTGHGTADTFAHPELWKLNVIRSMHRMKLEPNPPGEDNFFFVNALNEWGEGNVLEPSVQWDDRYSTAFRDAMQVVDGMLWRHELIKAGESVLIDEMLGDPRYNETRVDVCVLVRVSATSPAWKSPWDVPETLRSLQAQSNHAWRAVVFRAAGGADNWNLHNHVLDTFDPRIVAGDVPDEAVTSLGGGAEWKATDWIINNLDTISPPCASASYMLLSTSGNTYEPRTFDLSDEDSTKPDFVGLRYASGLNKPASESIHWQQRCSRLADGTTEVCRTPGPNELNPDFSLINLPRWRRESHSFFQHVNDTDSVAGFLKQLTTQPGETWSWLPPISGKDADICDVIYQDTYLSCIRTGRMWLDIPHVDDKVGPGCHSMSSIWPIYGGNLDQWDMDLFKENPLCLRMSEKKYADIVANLTSSASPNAPAVNPPAENPTAENPPVEKPLPENPPAENPSTADAPAANPPAANPPAANPPAENPPAANPPAANPSAADPPGANPPDANVPTANPPATNPPNPQDATPPGQ